LDNVPGMPAVRRPLRQARPRAGAAIPRGRRVGPLTFGIVNFKSIASAHLEPKRLTIVAGSNSSGKSSLLQALLFSAQSFGEPTPVINGDLVQLGEASDVIRDGSDDLTLEFIYPEHLRDESGVPTAELPRSLRITLASRDGGQSLTANEVSLWRGRDCICSAENADAPEGIPLGDEEQVLRVKPSHYFSLPSDCYITVAGITPARVMYLASEEELRFVFDRALEGAQGSRWPFEELLRGARGIIGDEAKQTRLAELMKINVEQGLSALNQSDKDLVFEAFTEVEAPAGWITEPIAPLPRNRSVWRAPSEAHGGNDASLLARDLGRALDHVERLTDAVLYMGPLRDDPRVAYPLGHTVRALPVGEKGEFTAAYLRDNQRARLSYFRPDGTRRSDLLPNAVDDWCAYLGIADRIKVTPQGKLGHQLGLRIGGQERDPTAVGVGASQLLPVVVLVLGAPEGSIVLLEQPELHLHPKVQSRLADFFAFARPDIRIIVETHSEYLLTRLRRRIAEGKIDRNDIAVLFASQKPESNEGKVEAVYTDFDHLTVNALGDFDVWPVDFFDSLDQDAVALARAISETVRAKQDESPQ
jgi:predicted ATPase